MTNETRERIRAYKKLLPGMRERVLGVALLLATSVAMMVTASFAWITLSRAPEVTGMQTTVAANGNLEIALAQGPIMEYKNDAYERVYAKKPNESAIGDSSAAQGIVGANTTWGNLVNVSDPIYGISQIALRPALLSDYNLNANPLYGASYGEDGRVVATTDKYEYASWKDFGNGDFRFGAGKDVQYGVRAISSVKYENITGNSTATQFEKAVNDAYGRAINGYYGIVSNDQSVAVNLSEKPGEFKSSITALEGLVTVFAHVRVKEMGMEHSSKPSTSCTPHIYYFYKMLLLFRDVLDAEGEALLHMANWQAWSQSADGKTNTFKDIEDLKSKASKLSDYGVELTTLASHISDYNNVTSAIDSLRDTALQCQDPDDPNNPEVTWASVEPAVRKLLNVGTTSIGGTELNKLDTSAAIGLVLSNSTQSVVIKEGVLKNFEERVLVSGDRMAANVVISIKAQRELLGFMVPVEKDVKGRVTTNATGDPLRGVDQATSAAGAIGGIAGDAVAKDTYGMAIDLWVRTNYPQAMLTLEGSAIYEDKPVTGLDNENKTVDLYILSNGDMQVDVYQKNGTWYVADTHEAVPAEYLEGATTEKKTEQVIVGYQGENRVWEDWENMLELGYIEKDATTQGAGSCYVFYASPADQPKILDLLSAFTIAFVDQEGKTLGTAALNTKQCYENQGKVTVPLEITSGVSYTDEDGKTHMGITNLQQNTPTRITAIIYLNGRNLKNENVLSAGEIQGQLNIQFGTNATLVSPEDEELMGQYRTITAEVEADGKKVTNSTIELDYNANGYEVKAKLAIDGEQPERISGFFVRMINATQGTRGKEISFVRQADGTWLGEWKGDNKLKSPGNYVLNTLIVDGVQYNLHDDNHPAIFIEGLELDGVSTDKSSGTYMLSEKSFPVTVTAEISSQIEPRRVTAIFYNEDRSKQYSALMTRTTGNQWVGTANIDESDTFTLTYITVATDGETYTIDVPAAQQTKLKLYLGLRAAVYTTLENWGFEVEYEDGKIKTQHVPMYVRVWDGGGNLMKDLSNVTLYYHKSTSSMDSDGTSTVLTWTEQNGGYYVADMGIGDMGIYSANRLVVSMMGQSSALYDLNDDAPVFTCYSPLPPEYVGSGAAEYQLAISKPAQYTVNLANTVGATVSGTFTRTDGEGTQTVTATAITDTDYTFDLTGDGIWQLTDIHVATPGGQHDLAAIDADGNEAAETKIVSTVNATANYTKDVLNGVFMQTHNETVTIEVKDYAGEAIQGLDSAIWAIKHDASKQQEYGGYVNTVAVQGGNSWNADVTVNGATATVTGTQAFQVAGDYTSEVTLNFKDGQFYKMTSNAPKFTVKSAKPTLKVTEVSSNSGYYYPTSDPSNTTGMISTSVANNWKAEDGYMATVYMYVSGTSGSNAVNIQKPNVTLSLTDIAAGHTGAKVVIPNVASFDFKNSATATAAVGAGTNGDTNWRGNISTYPKFSPAGTQTISEITVSYGSFEVVVELSHELVINNPQRPYSTTFVIDNDTYPGRTPADIVSITGESEYTITLPSRSDVTTSWTEAKTDTETGAFTETSHTTTTYYETWRDCERDQYQQYDKHVIVSQADETVISYTRTYTITGWKVGNATYGFGETITVTGSPTINAVISYSDSGHQTTENIVTRTTKYFVAGNNTDGTPPAGFVNVTSDPDNDNKDRWTSSNPDTVDVRTPKN